MIGGLQNTTRDTIVSRVQCQWDLDMTFLLNRRNVLTAAGAMVAPAAMAKTEGKIELLAEGVVPFVPTAFILSPTAPAIPPQVLQAILAGVLQARIRVIYPSSKKRDILTVHVYLAGPTDPLPLLSSPPTTVPPTISIFEIQVEEVVISLAKRSFVAAGLVVSNRVVSPFGDLTGLAAVVSAGFASTGTTTFTMLGGIVAGSHASYAPAGAGFLNVSKEAKDD
jgi:hypothetical protein